MRFLYSFQKLLRFQILGWLQYDASLCQLEYLIQGAAVAVVAVVAAAARHASTR